MRSATPSVRWLKKFDVAFIANGGHDGPATIATVRAAHALPLYRLGATAAAAGKAAADAYRLHGRLQQAEERAS